MKQKKKIWRWIVLAVVVIAIVAFVFLNQSRNSGSGFTEESVRTGSLETHYSFSGNIAIRDSQNVLAKVNGTVRDLYVAEDDAVSAGTPLLRLSNGDIIKADISGEVTELHVSTGDTVTVGTALADIINFDDLQVVIKVDEYDVSAVTPGKVANVTIGALGATYETTVEHISKQASNQMLSSGGTSSSSSLASASSGSDVTFYEAKLAAPDDPRILAGMNVDVTILNERVDNAMLLPMSALQFDSYNKPYVYIRGSNGQAVVQSVSVGLQDGTTVQILDGLRSGETVLVPQSLGMFPMMGQMRNSNGT